MRLGIVSDIHCNIASLDMALGRMGAVGEVLCVGDAILRFGFSNAVTGRLREDGKRLTMFHGSHRACSEYLYPQTAPMDEFGGLGADSYAVVDTQSGEVTFDVYDDPMHTPSDVNL